MYRITHLVRHFDNFDRTTGWSEVTVRGGLVTPAYALKLAATMNEREEAYGDPSYQVRDGNNRLVYPVFIPSNDMPW